jgi:hypothetical protein
LVSSAEEEPGNGGGGAGNGGNPFTIEEEIYAIALGGHSRSEALYYLDDNCASIEGGNFGTYTDSEGTLSQQRRAILRDCARTNPRVRWPTLWGPLSPSDQRSSSRAPDASPGG